MDRRNDEMKRIQITWKDGLWARREIYREGEHLVIPSRADDPHPDIGWFTSPIGGEQVSNTTVVKENATFFAHWREKLHKVEFDTSIAHQHKITFMRDGSSTEEEFPPIYVAHGSTIASIPSPEKAGYNFLGWFNARDVKLRKDTQILEDMVVHAHWTAMTYDIIYDLGGIGHLREGVWSQFTLDAIQEMPGGTYTPKAPVSDRIDMEFVRWEPAALPSDTPYDFTFTAIWRKKKFNVTFNPSGGKFDDGSNSSKVIVMEYGTVIALGDMPSISRDGYDHDGWYCGNVKVDETFELTITGQTTFTSHWDAQPRTVIFKWLDDENVMRSVTVVKDADQTPIEYGDVIDEDILELNGIPIAPTKRGSSFNGWISDDGVSFDMELPVTDDIAYEARWNGNIMVTFDPSPGTFGAITIPYSSFQNISDFAPQNVQRDGYLFQGWVTQDEGESLDEDTQAQGNVTYKASWKADYITITFHPNDDDDDDALSDGVGTVTQIALKERYVVLSDNPFSRPGFDFCGWSRTKGSAEPDDDLDPNNPMTEYSADDSNLIGTESDDGDDGVNYSDSSGSDIDDWTDVDYTINQPNAIVAKFESDVDLYAVWTESEYTVTFNANGGRFEGSTATAQTINVGYEQTVPQNGIPSASKDGCLFDGWYTYWDALLTPGTTIHADTTFYAHWKDDETGEPDQETKSNTVPEDVTPQPTEPAVDYNNPAHFKAMGGCPESIPVRYSGPSGGYVRYQNGKNQPIQSCNPFTMTSRGEVYTCKKTGKQCYRLTLAKASKTTPSTTSPTWYHKNKVPKYWYLTSGQTKTPQMGAEDIQLKPGKDAFIPFEFLQRICGSDGKCSLGFYVYMKEVKA